MNKTTKIILIIILISAIFRLANADRILISDEVFWANAAKNLAILGDPIGFKMYDDIGRFFFHPPLGLLFYSCSYMMFGMADFFFRLFPIIFGLLTIFFTYILGKEIYSQKVGLLASLLMGISVYHVIASQTVDVDGSFLTFFNLITIILFIIYKKTNKKIYIFSTYLFLILSILTKLSGVLIIVPLILYSYFHNKKNTRIDTFYLILMSLISIMILYIISIFLGNTNYFFGPISHIFGSIGASFSETILVKIFNVGHITWQLTPFLSILFLLILLTEKRDKKFYFLISWVLFFFFVFLIPNLQGAAQRYFSVALPPFFVLIALYIKNKVRSKKNIIVIIIFSFLTAILAYALNLNDLMGYTNPPILLLFYVISIIVLIPKKHRYSLLVGGFIGLSIYLLLTANYWPAQESNLIESMASKTKEFGFPPDQVWSGKDIMYHIADKNQIQTFKPPPLNIDEIRKNNIKYISVYAFQYENELKNLSNYCIRKYLAEINNHTVGIVCELS